MQLHLQQVSKLELQVLMGKGWVFWRFQFLSQAPKPMTRFIENLPLDFAWMKISLGQALLDGSPQKRTPNICTVPCLTAWELFEEFCLALFLLPVFQIPWGYKLSAVMAVLATLRWETLQEGGHQSPSPHAGRTAQNCTASTQTKTSSTWPPVAVGSLAAPNATPTSLITPISLLTWQMISSQIQSPGGSLPKGCTGKKSGWTSKLSSTWPTSSLCSSPRAQPRWCWKDPRTMGRLGGPTSISLSTVQRLSGSRMISLRRAPCVLPDTQMQCPAPEER